MAEQKPRIVVIDDSAASISLYRRSSETLNVELSVFQTPTESLEFLESSAADLIFTGIIMRGTDGWSILKNLRKWDHHQNTPIVVVTSKNYAQDRALAEQLGAREYLVKPLRSQEIREIIRKYTGAQPVQIT